MSPVGPIEFEVSFDFSLVEGVLNSHIDWVRELPEVPRERAADAILDLMRRPASDLFASRESPVANVFAVTFQEWVILNFHRIRTAINEGSAHVGS